MQETRQHILEILRLRGHATVGQIAKELQPRLGKRITAVTVRHHLMRLQDDELVSEPQLLHRTTPGRPQHVYTLTEKALAFFPNNYKKLAAGLLEQIEQILPPDSVNVIFDGIARNMAQDAILPNGPMQEKVSAVVNYLNENGYDAAWERCSDGFVLHTRNCPYHHIAQSSESLCTMDMRLISVMLGVVPRMLSRIADNQTSCSYLIPQSAES